jgi:hypothetical protein
MTHVVSPNLSRRVRQAVWVFGTRRVEQEPRRFNGVTGNTDNARPLPVTIALFVSIHDPSDHSGFIVFDMAINSRPRDGRPATIQDGFCFQGIRSNAKWSTLNTEIPKGEATGNLEVRPQCHVLLPVEHSL